MAVNHWCSGWTFLSGRVQYTRDFDINYCLSLMLFEHCSASVSCPLCQKMHREDDRPSAFTFPLHNCSYVCVHLQQFLFYSFLLLFSLCQMLCFSSVITCTFSTTISSRPILLFMLLSKFMKYNLNFFNVLIEFFGKFGELLYDVTGPKRFWRMVPWNGDFGTLSHFVFMSKIKHA